ncbi:MAG TPA: hypothetical protein PLB62_01890 [Candidatus Sumerlaeota bacterium]|nr:hypothetical protein [Candidatus Sumerlaeota bacterium]
MFGFLKRILKRIFLVEDEFLCDTCRYDYGDVCRRSERPNAVKCPDYKRR